MKLLVFLRKGGGGFQRGFRANSNWNIIKNCLKRKRRRGLADSIGSMNCWLVSWVGESGECQGKKKTQIEENNICFVRFLQFWEADIKENLRNSNKSNQNPTKSKTYLN